MNGECTTISGCSPISVRIFKAAPAMSLTAVAFTGVQVPPCGGGKANGRAFVLEFLRRDMGFLMGRIALVLKCPGFPTVVQHA